MDKWSRYQQESGLDVFVVELSPAPNRDFTHQLSVYHPKPLCAPDFNWKAIFEQITTLVRGASQKTIDIKAIKSLDPKDLPPAIIK